MNKLAKYELLRSLINYYNDDIDIYQEDSCSSLIYRIAEDLDINVVLDSKTNKFSMREKAEEKPLNKKDFKKGAFNADGSVKELKLDNFKLNKGDK